MTRSNSRVADADPTASCFHNRGKATLGHQTAFRAWLGNNMCELLLHNWLCAYETVLSSRPFNILRLALFRALQAPAKTQRLPSFRNADLLANHG